MNAARFARVLGDAGFRLLVATSAISLDNPHCGPVILASSGVYSLAARPVWVVDWTAGSIFSQGPILSRVKRLRKLINYMSISSPSDRKVPKSFAFIALLGLLLIAAVAFVPNSNAGLTASQNGGGPGAKRSPPEFVPGEALARFKSGRAFEGQAYIPVPTGPGQPTSDRLQAASPD